MCKTVFIYIFLCAGIFMKIAAQNGELIAIDSLSKIVKASEIEQREKIRPMADLVQLYAGEGDSVNASKYLNEARALALQQKDSKYMIYVFNQELQKILNTYPRNITEAYRLVDSIYAAVSKTGDREAQAWGYVYIATAKHKVDLKYDFGDYFTALSIAEKLPEQSEKYKLLFLVYSNLDARNTQKQTGNAEKYLDLMRQASEKSGIKNSIGYAMYVKLSHMAFADSSKNKNAILEHAEQLEQYISENGNSLGLVFYGRAINNLKIIFGEYPYASHEEMMELNNENFKRNVRNRNNFLAKETLLYMSINEAPNEEAIELYREQLIPLDKAKNPFFLSRDYENLSFLYTETGQHRQATEAMNESMKYYKEFVNAQTEEQRQLAEVKFETEKKENELRLAETKNMLFLSFGIFAISLSIFLVIYFVKRHTRIRLEKENAELQRKIAEQQAKRKEYEVEMTQRKLEASGMQVAKKDKTLEKISQKTEDSEIKKLIRDDKAGDKSYDDYSKIFGEIHPGFFEALNNRADPQKLTALEQRYCAYIYMHKSNKEIADELNITQNTVKSNKSELKRKLKIDRNTDFEEFLRNIVP